MSFGVNTDTRTLTFGDGGSTDSVVFFIGTAGLSLTTYRIVVTTTDHQQRVEPVPFEPPITYHGFVAPDGIGSVAIEHAFSHLEPGCPPRSPCGQPRLVVRSRLTSCIRRAYDGQRGRIARAKRGSWCRLARASSSSSGRTRMPRL